MLRIVGEHSVGHTHRCRYVAGTGSHCPVSGIWAPIGVVGQGRQVLEGSIMPTHSNAAVVWHLVQGLTSRDIRS